MIFLSINPSNYNKPIKNVENVENVENAENDKKKSKKNKNNKSKKNKIFTPIKLLNDSIKSGKHIFFLIYMEGCGPCMATRPEWTKIQNVLGEKYKNKYNNILVVDIDYTLLSSVKLSLNPAGFPTIMYVSEKGKHTQQYEDSDVSKKDRTVDSFIEWVEGSIKKYHISSNNKNIKGGFRYSRRNHSKTQRVSI